MALIAAVVLSQAQAPVPSAANLSQWLAYIKPSPEECTFEQVEWRPVLWDAVIEAQRQDKPILLWAMNGHPMGCT